MFRGFLLPVLAVVATASPAFGALIAGWSMTAAVPSGSGGANYVYGAADQGESALNSQLSSVHAGASTAVSSPTGNGSPYSFSSNNWLAGDYYEVSIDLTAQWSDLWVSWDQTRSSTGPSSFELQRSIDGAAFTTFLPYMVQQAGASGSGTTTWNSTTYQAQFTIIPTMTFAFSAQDSIVLRFVATANASSPTGTNRIDNIMVHGTAVPAPGVLALLGAMGLGGGRTRRRREYAL